MFASLTHLIIALALASSIVVAVPLAPIVREPYPGQGGPGPEVYAPRDSAQLDTFETINLSAPLPAQDAEGYPQIYKIYKLLLTQLFHARCT